jgi:FG-GAP-like repeat
MKEFILAALVLQLSAAGCNVRSQRSSYATGANPDALPFRAIHLPVATHPTMVTIADVNKDGNPDILVANGGSGNVSVYIGDGKGGFLQATGSPFSAGQSPADITTGDFNGDSNLDIAIANHGVKLVTVLLGNGKGQFAFAPGSPFNIESNPHPHGIAVADFNGDKKLDIAVDSWAESKVLVLFGKGDGTFQSPGMKFDVGKMPYQRLRTADMNEDGNIDIITSNFEAGSLSVLLSDGRGSFTRKDFPVPPDPFGIAIADLNGDRHLDIAIAHYSGQGTDPSKNALSVLYGDGKGNFTLAKGSPFPTGHYPGTVAAGDLNGDGIADIVVPNYEDGTLTIYLCTRNGITLAPYSPIRVGHTPHGVAIADLNHDGKGDIVLTEEEDNDVLVLLGK